MSEGSAKMLLIDQSGDYPNFQCIKQYVEYLKFSGGTRWGGLVDIVAAAKAFNVNVRPFYPHIIKNDWIYYSPDTVDQTTAWNQKKREINIVPAIYQGQRQHPQHLFNVVCTAFFYLFLGLSEA
ncbi:hypothetical protein GPALN_015069 [Globodera pallida]|nr:hypothetical protein GPALN_015069 [Globodera pallida]